MYKRRIYQIQQAIQFKVHEQSLTLMNGKDTASEAVDQAESIDCGSGQTEGGKRLLQPIQQHDLVKVDEPIINLVNYLVNEAINGVYKFWFY